MTGDLRERLEAALGPAYSIERELGGGAMSRVFVATETRLGRRVVVKVLPPELAAEVSAERFEREIQLAARLQHPHIVPVLSAGDAGGLLYYVMPFVEGESLQGRLARAGELPIADAAALLRDVASALAYAHRQGVVHRDLKPGNILVSEGSALVADFGLAKAVGDAASSGSLTATGMTVGTPAYMAPEQAAGDPQVDARADLYAFGCVAYELLAGRPPFTAPTLQALLAAHIVHAPEPVTTHRPNVPPALARLVARCLEKRPADRPQSADELLLALDGVKERDPATSGSHVAGRRRWLLGAAGAVLVVGAVSLAMLIRSRSPRLDPSASRIVVIPFAADVPDTGLARLGRDLAVTLSTSLDGIDDLRVVDPVAVLGHFPDVGKAVPLDEAVSLGRQLGARSVVHGSLVRIGREVRLDFGLFATDSARLLARVSATAAFDSVPALTDAALWKLLPQVWRHGTPPTPSVEALTTRSMTSLRAFLAGERLRAEGQHARAAMSYREAIGADSTFWLAYVRYAAAKAWILEPVEPSIVQAYRAHADELPERERLLVRANMAESLSTRLALLRHAAEAYPDNWLAWMSYGDVLVHSAPGLGHDIGEARSPLEHVVAINPRWSEAWEHLLWLAFDRDSVAADTIARRLGQLGWDTASPPQFGYDELLFHRVRGMLRRDPRLVDSPAADSLVRAYAEGRIRPQVIVQSIALLLHLDGNGRGQIDLSRRVLRRGTTAESAQWHRRAIALAWAARGGWDSAEVAMDQYLATADAPEAARDAYRLAVIGSWLGALDPTVAARRRAALEPLRTRLSAADAAEALYLDGVLATARHDRRSLDVARAGLRALAGGARPVGTSVPAAAAAFEKSLASFALDLAGKRREALDSLASLESQRAEYPGAPDDLRLAVNRLAAARWYLDAGDPERAAALSTWQEAILPHSQWFFAESVVAGLAYLERARAEDRSGQRERALKDYREFLRRYDAPEPAQRGLVSEAAQAIERLSGASQTSRTVSPGVPQGPHQ